MRRRAGNEANDVDVDVDVEVSRSLTIQQQQQQQPGPRSQRGCVVDYLMALEGFEARELDAALVAQIREVVWPPAWQADEALVVDVWFMHDVEFAPGCGVGIVQRQNGPCGVLAALQAAMLRELYLRHRGAEYFALEEERTSRAVAAGSHFKSLEAAHAEADDEDERRQAQRLADNREFDAIEAELEAIVHPDARQVEWAFVSAVARVLLDARPEPSARVRLVVFADQIRDGGAECSGYHDLTSELVVLECDGTDRDAVQRLVTLVAPHLRATGGLVLLLYSLVATRTPEGVRADMDSSKLSMFNAWGDMTLVAGELCFCSHTVVHLLLAGRAYFDDPKQQRADIGFLSAEEMDDGVLGCLVHDHLKIPRYPIWLVGGTGHYSLLFSPQLSATRVPAMRFSSPPPKPPPPPPPAVAPESTPAPPAPDTTPSAAAAPASTPAADIAAVSDAEYNSVSRPSAFDGPVQGPCRPSETLDGSLSRFNAPLESNINEFTLWHYNGLPPAGPRLAALHVSVPMPVGSAGTATAANSEWRVPSTIVARREVVPAALEGSSTTGAVSYEFEVAIQRRDDKTEVYEAITQPIPPPWREGEKWRCRDCTLAVPVVWSARNEPDSSTCVECAKPLSECGRCIWLSFDQLPPAKQKEVQSRYAPAIEKLIQTRWYTATVTPLDGAPPSL